MAGFKSQETGAEEQEEKAMGKNVPRNPFHNLPENLLNTYSVPTVQKLCPVFIGLILGTKKIKDTRPH